MADIRLHAVDGHDDRAVLAEGRGQTLAVGGRQRAQFIVAAEEGRDGAFGEDNVAAREVLVNFGDAAVVGVAQGTDEGQDVEAKLVAWEGDSAFSLGRSGWRKHPQPWWWQRRIPTRRRRTASRVVTVRAL
jgi:hypothetical protein